MEDNTKTEVVPRQVKPRVSDLFVDRASNVMSLIKSGGVLACLTLSAGFLKEAWQRQLTFETFVGYAIAMAVSSSPTLARMVIGGKYPSAQASPAPETPR